MSDRRQPIVAVLGHVDHGKTSLLDHVRSLGQKRQASVMDREAGGITQHIGATEVPANLLNEYCGPLLGGTVFASPGLLFIDTPGHHSFTTLRSRGGALADIAILTIDIMEGCRPQTIESLRILKQAKTPFVVAANKVDRIHGWNTKEDRSMAVSLRDQSKETMSLYDERYWKLVGQFAEEGFNLERYDKISDFTKEIALVPCSAKQGEGIQDVLAVVIGLAERYLDAQLRDVDGSGEATVLELKEERGLGKTLDLILYRGALRKGDEIVFATERGGMTSSIKGIFAPRGMSEMRDAGNRWDSVEEVNAAAGVKISAQNLDGVLAGTTLRIVHDEEQRAAAMVAADEESTISVDLEDDGVSIKADTLGGLEALAFELGARKVPIRAATIGSVTKKDVRSAAASNDPLHRVILAFSTGVLAEAQTELDEGEPNVEHIAADVIYHILDGHEKWLEETEQALTDASREITVHPGRIMLLPDHTFRRSQPAVVGIRVLGGRIHIGQRLLQQDGTRVGRVKSIRSGDVTMNEALQGDEVALAIQGAVVGRGVEEGDVLLVDVPASHARRLRQMDLSVIEEEILQELTDLHRKDSHFWGR
jgi:translation initiation factor 5B